MRDIWQQIRVGRHPGFEEGTYDPACHRGILFTLRFHPVWPLIAANLEFKPRSEDVAVEDGKEAAGGEC